MTMVSGLILLLMLLVGGCIVKVDGPVYVQKRHQGSSVGQALLETILREEN